MTKKNRKIKQKLETMVPGTKNRRLEGSTLLPEERAEEQGLKGPERELGNLIPITGNRAREAQEYILDLPPGCVGWQEDLPIQPTPQVEVEEVPRAQCLIKSTEVSQARVVIKIAHSQNRGFPLTGR